MSGYIYIVQTPAYRGTDVFKIGRSWQRLEKLSPVINRLKAYPKGTQVVGLFAIPEGTETRVETLLKETLKGTFELVRGQEWFRAPLHELLPVVLQELNRLCQPAPCRIPMEVQPNVQDAIIPQEEDPEGGPPALEPPPPPPRVQRISVAAATRLVTERLTAEGKYAFYQGRFWIRDTVRAPWTLLQHEREHFALALPPLLEDLQIPLEVTRAVVQSVMREAKVIFVREELHESLAVEDISMERFMDLHLVKEDSAFITLSQIRKAYTTWIISKQNNNKLKLNDIKRFIEQRLGNCIAQKKIKNKNYHNVFLGWKLHS